MVIQGTGNLAIVGKYLCFSVYFFDLSLCCLFVCLFVVVLFVCLFVLGGVVVVSAPKAD